MEHRSLMPLCTCSCSFFRQFFAFKKQHYESIARVVFVSHIHRERGDAVLPEWSGDLKHEAVNPVFIFVYCCRFPKEEDRWTKNFQCSAILLYLTALNRIVQIVLACAWLWMYHWPLSIVIELLLEFPTGIDIIYPVYDVLIRICMSPGWSELSAKCRII